MTKTYTGKTKDVYSLPDGNLLLKFKDDATGEDGVFDPGANTVGLSIDGLGRSNLELTEYYFQLIEKAGYPTHFVSADINQSTMTVRPAKKFGKGLEVICRFKAVGSFIKRYGAYAAEGQDLPAFVEVTIKDDDRGDPPISKEALAILNILTHEEYDKLKAMTQGIAGLIKDDFAKKGLELYDIKLEFGRVGDDIVLIDEISVGNLRAYKNNESIAPIVLTKMVLGRLV